MTTPPVVLLQVSRVPDGGVALATGLAGRAPVRGWLSAEAGAAIAPDPVLAVVPMALIPGMDLARVQREEAWGRRVAGALASAPTVATALARALGIASAGSGTPALVISSDTPTLAALPWELLCDTAGGACLEMTGQAVVVRLVPQATACDPPPTGASRLRVLTWAPDASDPAVSQLLAAARDSDEVEVEALPADLGVLPPAQLGTVDVLHLVCHGERGLSQLSILLDGGRAASAGSATALLRPLLSRCALVLLDVCHGGMAAGGATGGLGQRLIEAGAPACVAASTAVGVDAAAAFAAGCIRSLATGATLHGAVGEGRRRVAAAGIDHPEARWHNHRLLVGSIQRLHAPPVSLAGWRPPGFPRPCPGADSLWAGVQGHAETMGFLGIEAVALGLLSADLPPRQAAGLAGRLAGVRAAVELRVGALRRAPDMSMSTGAAWVTRRLAQFGDHLPAELALDALLEHLSALLMASEAPGLAHASAACPPDAPLVLEVMGGPEDGKMFILGVGETLGRWSPTPPQRSDHGLYGGTPVFDPGLSRSPAARALGGGRVEVMRPGVWWRAAAGAGGGTFETVDSMASDGMESRPSQTRPGTVCSLKPGDELWLSVRPTPTPGTPCVPVTRLRVLPG